MKVIAVIPAYNEEVMISGVINRAKKYVDDVIVVDDCSTDKTPEILKELGVIWILHDKNCGAGKSTSDGIKSAITNGADIVVTLDGDGQHIPRDIPYILKPILNNEADVTIGVRFSNDYYRRKMPKYRQFGNKVITWFYNVGNKQKVSDSQCCFRAFNRKALEQFSIEDYGFGFTCETLIKCWKANLRVNEVPITCIYHDDFKLNSSMNPIKHGVIAVLKTIYWRLKVSD